ncbi:Ni/Fe-hydrogenase cytochrome b subunit [Superficieibacter sp. 1612_C1]|uniref:Ni/Fe-hydrogenase cytochrome b subunit n=1 Tax=Superficieibacter sp. 1612_C1 TaxID=2780382 RepID=UPI00188438A4|nr:Ni/Fe-hydrogenase cytochrome b subunit [Superficieibacter sp. 1612_C1]
MSDHTHALRPLGGKLFTRAIYLFAPFAAICGLLIVKRLVMGMGDVTALNGGYPWGVWISFDLLVGTGFACGGWAMAWAVYVFNRGDYHDLVRPALLASLFGYGLGGLSITIDLGRYWNVPHFLMPGYFNTNSVLFETAACMTVYIGIMSLELLPALLERLGWHVPLRKLNRAMFIFISIGALLPCMHQSSMGSLMMIAGYKVYPLWQSYEFLPLFSLLTAFLMGFSIVIFEGSLLRASATFTTDETPLFSKLSQVIKALLWIFVVLRVGEIIWRGKLGLVLMGNGYAWLFIIELALFILPLLILHSGKLRRSPRALFLCALSVLLGAAMWRIDYSLVAFDPGNGYHYFPTASELLISIGFVAIEVVAYILIIRLLPILPAKAATVEVKP